MPLRAGVLVAVICCGVFVMVVALLRDVLKL